MGRLLLTRTEHEAVIITCRCGEPIRVSINRVEGDKVSLCFEADRCVNFMREDLLDDQENPCSRRARGVE